MAGIEGVSSSENSPAKVAQDKANAAASMGKDAFLKLLVAQMKYQDPMEPTSNTEFISQYATFSELEQMQNMSSTLELSRASSYVGKTVCIRTQTSDGEYKELEGKVDYVTFEGGKAKLAVNGQLYEIKDVYATIDPVYKEAVELASAFKEAVDGLSALENMTLENKDMVDTIDNLREGYNKLTAYQKSFIAKELVEKLQKYVERLSELREAAKPEKPADTQDSGKTEEGGKTQEA